MNKGVYFSGVKWKVGYSVCVNCEENNACVLDRGKVYVWGPLLAADLESFGRHDP